MGIFSVYLAPLYGEGAAHAFLRLQEEILRRSDDMSLLAWGILNQEDQPIIHHTTLETFDSDDSALTASLPVLATSPADFAGMGSVVCAPLPPSTPTISFELTNKGLHITLPLLQVGHSTHSTSQKYYLAALACRHEKEDPHDRIGIFLTSTTPAPAPSPTTSPSPPSANPPNSSTTPSLTPLTMLRTPTKSHTRLSGEDLALPSTLPHTLYISLSPDTFSDPSAEEEKLFIKASELISPGYEVIDICAKHATWNREFAVARIVGMKLEEGKAGEVGVYQLATVMFFNRHLGSGFVARILVGNGEGEVWVDLAPTPPKPAVVDPEDEDEALNRIRGEGRRLWERPGRVVLMRLRKVGGRMVERRGEVEVVNPEAVGDEEGEGSVKERGGGEAGELRGEVVFEERWEKVYQRVVSARVERRRRGVLVLEMGSMLFEGA